MSTRPVEQWAKLLSGLSATGAAKRILGDLRHYRHGGAYEHTDEEQLAHALIGFVVANRLTEKPR